LLTVPFIMDPRTHSVNTGILGNRKNMEEATKEYFLKFYSNINNSEEFSASRSRIEKIQNIRKDTFSEIILEFYDESNSLQAIPISEALSEVEIYLGSAPSNLISFGIEKNIFKFWNNMSNTYPKITRMVQDFLTIQASNASSERLFSAAGNFFDNKRCRTKATTLRYCICLKYWILKE
jgi:hypothetical protein